MERINLNAATGYQIERGLPSPEVFERPGWEVVMAYPGYWRWVVVRSSKPVTFAYEPDMAFSLETDEVAPAIYGVTYLEQLGPRLLRPYPSVGSVQRTSERLEIAASDDKGGGVSERHESTVERLIRVQHESAARLGELFKSQFKSARRTLDAVNRCRCPRCNPRKVLP